MSIHAADENARPAYDEVLSAIADYALNFSIKNDLAYETAYLAFLDSLGCAFLALHYSACTKLLGPIVPGTIVPQGVRVPGTAYALDPVKAAFDIGTLIRWLDFNDTWLAAEWGHPSDNLGGILAVADYLDQRGKTLTIKDVLTAMIKAYEIQGVLALENSFNRVGLDHVVLVKVATTAVVTHLLGGNKAQVLAALSQAWLDGQSLRVYRHAPNTGSRKSWAAGDATSRGVRLALMTLAGEMGYPSVLTAKKWGFNDVLFGGQPFSLPQPFNSYVMENILFKIAFPAEFHAQTAVEAAIQLSPQIKNRLSEIEKIVLTTQEAAIRIISKSGKLYNPADRDHCLQYMVAVALLHGDLQATFYENDFAEDPRIDQLRSKMVVEEDKQFSKDYLLPEKRSIANAVQIYFTDGSSTEKILIEYPLGHKKRRAEGVPLLWKKFTQNMTGIFTNEQQEIIWKLCQDREQLMAMRVSQLMSILRR